MAFYQSDSGMFDGFDPIPGSDWLRTDATGHVEVELVPAVLMISASKRGHDGARSETFHADDAPAELELTIEPEPRIAGQVFAGGEPLAGAAVTVGQRIPGFIKGSPQSRQGAHFD